jgi:phosphate transport system permease protein
MMKHAKIKMQMQRIQSQSVQLDSATGINAQNFSKTENMSHTTTQTTNINAQNSSKTENMSHTTTQTTDIIAQNSKTPLNFRNGDTTKHHAKSRPPFDIFLSIITYGAAGLTILALISIIGYIIIMGIPNLKPSLFSLTYTNDNVSIIPALITTIEMTLLSLVIAVPLGIFTAIYLTEYAKRGNKLVGLVRVTAETLSGIPSIVYGLFGMLFFVTTLGLGFSLIAGACTLSIMILPLIMRTTEEALISVPDSYREGSFGLGAGRLRTVFKIVLPAAIPGILSGIILAVGRIVGETAALIYTAGTATDIPMSVTDSARTLSIHMYVLSNEGIHTGEAYATALILLVMVIGINALAAFAAKKLTKI